MELVWKWRLRAWRLESLCIHNLSYSKCANSLHRVAIKLRYYLLPHTLQFTFMKILTTCWLFPVRLIKLLFKCRCLLSFRMVYQNTNFWIYCYDTLRPFVISYSFQNLSEIRFLFFCEPNYITATLKKNKSTRATGFWKANSIL